jgi:hypothetical protein
VYGTYQLMMFHESTRTWWESIRIVDVRSKISEGEELDSSLLFTTFIRYALFNARTR